MKQKHLLSLLQGGYTTIQVVYLPNGSDPEMDHFVDAMTYAYVQSGPAQHTPVYKTGRVPAPWDNRAPSRKNAPHAYTYKAPLDAKVEAGDTVVVDSPKCGLCLARVVSVDPQPRIDVDADFDYKWIVQKVDRAAYDTRLEAERTFNDTLQEVERVKQREELVKMMTANLPEGSEARRLFDEAIKTVSGTLVIGSN